MTATRDQDVWRYALSLGYEDHGQTRGGHRKFFHPGTGRAVVIPSSYSDYAGYQNGLAQLRQGAGTSKRGRQAVVNTRRAPRAKKGANSARLAEQKLAQERARYRDAAEKRHQDQRCQPAPSPADTALRAALIKRVVAESYYRGLMRGV